MIKSPVTRVNALLKKAGHGLQLVRGRGYYYLRSTDDRCQAESLSFETSTSIYVFSLERTEKDFQFIRAEVNEKLASIKLATI